MTSFCSSFGLTPDRVGQSRPADFPPDFHVFDSSLGKSGGVDTQTTKTEKKGMKSMPHFKGNQDERGESSRGPEEIIQPFSHCL